MALEYFCCYHSYARKLARLSDQEVGRLFRALLKYSETGETQELTGRESLAFDFIADDIDRAKTKYDEKCRQNSKNAKGERQRTHTNASERSQDKDKDKDDKSPHTPHRGETDDEPQYKPKWFARFWALYPKNIKRAETVKEWDKLKPDRALCNVMAEAIRAQKKTAQWQRDGGRFIPSPSSWLNGRRWEDEIREEQHSTEQKGRIETTNPFLEIMMEMEEEKSGHN